MKNYFYLLILTLLLLIGCENETTTVVQRPIVQKPIEDSKKTPPTPTAPKKYSFHFKNLKGESSKLSVERDLYTFQNIEQPIVMISLFSTWCPPCRGEIPHLTNLQKSFKKNLFILGALVHDDIDKENLRKFTIAEKVGFFLSFTQMENLKFAEMITPKLGLSKDFTLPLMILFVNGKYFTHYEGNMPEEMIESDIKQALKKIKGGK